MSSIELYDLPNDEKGKKALEIGLIDAANGKIHEMVEGASLIPPDLGPEKEINDILKDPNNRDMSQALFKTAALVSYYQFTFKLKEKSSMCFLSVIMNEVHYGRPLTELGVLCGYANGVFFNPDTLDQVDLQSRYDQFIAELINPRASF
ncbi:MAG: hypothetical protein A2001_19270 [Treponema sp. GWC1_61_84]|nr:MAG: hypothetical protein A2001_19270 [Treponema sp. GWC1_61_84]